MSDGTLWGDVLAFVQAVLDQRQALSGSAGVILVLWIVDRWRLQRQQKRDPTIKEVAPFIDKSRVAVAAVLFACFLAWRGEREAVIKLKGERDDAGRMLATERDRSLPKPSMRLHQMTTMLPHGRDKNPLIVLGASVSNAGAPTSIVNYMAHVKVGGKTRRFVTTRVPLAGFTAYQKGAESLHFTNAISLFNNVTPLQTGEVRYGVLYFKVDADLIDQETAWTVHYSDFNGKEHASDEFVDRPANGRSEPDRYFPGAGPDIK